MNDKLIVAHESFGRFRIHTVDTGCGFELSISIGGRAIVPQGYPELRDMPLQGAFREGYAKYLLSDEVLELRRYFDSKTAKKEVK